MGEPFRQFTSRVVPLRAENVDTDQVVPARYLKVTDKAGLAGALFHDWRFAEDGSLKDPPFVIDRPEMRDKIIINSELGGEGNDYFMVPRVILAMKLFGLDKEVIDKVCYQNPRDFFHLPVD